MIQVTRQQFQEAIEAGLSAAEKLTYKNFDSDAVRVIGRNSPKAAVGDYLLDGIACPISQAFPYPEYLGIKGDLTFAMAYDDRMRDLTGNREEGAFYVEVVG